MARRRQSADGRRHGSPADDLDDRFRASRPNPVRHWETGELRSVEPGPRASAPLAKREDNSAEDKASEYENKFTPSSRLRLTRALKGDADGALEKGQGCGQAGTSALQA